MHFYFRPSLLLYVYSLVQTHHSSCSRRAGFFTKGCNKVVIVRIRRHENLIGMSFKFDRCWSESLSSTARGSTDLRSSCGRLFKLAGPSLVLEPLIQGNHLTAFELTNQLLYMNFPSVELKFFQKDLKSTLPSSVALWFRNLGNVDERKTWKRYGFVPYQLYFPFTTLFLAQSFPLKSY